MGQLVTALTHQYGLTMLVPLLMPDLHAKSQNALLLTPIPPLETPMVEHALPQLLFQPVPLLELVPMLTHQYVPRLMHHVPDQSQKPPQLPVPTPPLKLMEPGLKPTEPHALLLLLMMLMPISQPSDASPLMIAKVKVWFAWKPPL